MTTPTTHYGFGKPINGGDASTWGIENNAAWDAVDAEIFTQAGLAATASAAALLAATNAATAAAAAQQPFLTAIFQNQQASGSTSGEAISAATLTKRTLNTTVVNNIPSCSLASSQVTLPAGSYFFEAWTSGSPTSGQLVFKSRLRNTTAAATIASSTAADVSNLGWGSVGFSGFFVLGAPSVLELDSYFMFNAGNGGLAFGSGEPEVYNSLMLQKVA